MAFPPSYRWISGASLHNSERWEASLFVVDPERQASWQPLSRLRARIREGTRPSTAESRGRMMYRPSSITQMGLPWEPPSTKGESTDAGQALVKPGDVVLSKFLPIRTAWVTPSTPRLAIDANCVRISGLKQETGFWVAALLEHPFYQRHFARLSSSAALPRVGLNDLRKVRLPDPPGELAPLVGRWVASSETLATATRELDDLQQEVNRFVAADAPDDVDERSPRFHASREMTDVWLPAAAALWRFQQLAARRGWISLDVLVSASPSRMRARRPPSLRVLRLSDALGDFGFQLPQLDVVKQPSFRLYADPLHPDEVLLSVLGSASKVVYNYPPVETSIWIADQWVRLEAKVHTGSMALILRTRAVDWQLRQSATGVSRQFVSRNELHKIRVPRLNERLSGIWHERLCRVLERTAASRNLLQGIRAEVGDLVSRCVGSVS